MKKLLLLACAALTWTGCSKSDDNNDTCFQDRMTLKETNVEDDPAGNRVLITFDVTNNSDKDYDISSGSKTMDQRISVSTTDGTSYETSGVFTVTRLAAGATTSMLTTASYGNGKKYKGYAIKLTCR